jgi:aryl-alcohol dehydrogenase-like predicted oxidoreductase
MGTELPTRTLGRTGLEVTRLGFGAMELRDTPRSRPVSGEQAERVLNSVLDAGINFIDTSPDYGASEDRIGRYISHRRDEFYLATKCGCNVTPDGHTLGDPGHRWTADQFRKNIVMSLERMKTDHVDILQMHGGTLREVQQGGLVEALGEIKEAGKARFIGISTRHPELSGFVRLGAFDTFQIPYSALDRAHEASIQEAAEAGAGAIIRGGVAQGHLDRGGNWAKWDQAHLDGLADGMSRYEFILRFTLTHSCCHTTIVGTLDLDHLASNVAAAEAGPLPSDVYEEAKRQLEAIGEVPEG